MAATYSANRRQTHQSWGVVLAIGILTLIIGASGIISTIALIVVDDKYQRALTIPAVDAPAVVQGRTSPVALATQKLPENIVVRVARYERSALLDLLTADIIAHGGYHDANNPTPGHQFVVPAGYLDRIALLIEDSGRQYSYREVNRLADPQEPAVYRTWANDIYTTVDWDARHGEQTGIAVSFQRSDSIYRHGLLTICLLLTIGLCLILVGTVTVAISATERR